VSILFNDVSKWQGDIEWRVYPYPIVIMRGMYGTVVDTKFAANRAGAHARGLTVGIYHRPHNQLPYDQQSAAFVHAVDQLRADEFLALDLEYFPSSSPDDIPIERWRDVVSNWATTVKSRFGISTYMIYCPDSQADTAVGYRQPLWLARYSDVTPTHHYTAWQFSDSGSTPGISGAVDLNRTDLNLAAFKTAVGIGAFSPPPITKGDLPVDQDTFNKMFAIAMDKYLADRTPGTAGIDPKLNPLERVANRFAQIFRARQ